MPASACLPAWRLAIPIGFIGAYTTFSTFEYETFRSVHSGQASIGLLNIALSVIVGYFAVWLGVMAGRTLSYKSFAAFSRASQRLKEPLMLTAIPSIRVTMYLKEDRVPSVLDFLFKHHVAGATVVRAFAGFGSHHHLHTANLVDISVDLPVILQFVDTREKLGDMVPADC